MTRRCSRGVHEGERLNGTPGSLAAQASRQHRAAWQPNQPKTTSFPPRAPAVCQVHSHRADDDDAPGCDGRAFDTAACDAVTSPFTPARSAGRPPAGSRVPASSFMYMAQHKEWHPHLNTFGTHAGSLRGMCGEEDTRAKGMAYMQVKTRRDLAASRMFGTS